MDRDQLRIEALKLAHADIFPGAKGDPAAVIRRATAYAKWLLTEHDTDAKGPDYAARQIEASNRKCLVDCGFDLNSAAQQFGVGQFPAPDCKSSAKAPERCGLAPITGRRCS